MWRENRQILNSSVKRFSVTVSTSCPKLILNTLYIQYSPAAPNNVDATNAKMTIRNAGIEAFNAKILPEKRLYSGKHTSPKKPQTAIGNKAIENKSA